MHPKFSVNGWIAPLALKPLHQKVRSRNPLRIATSACASETEIDDDSNNPLVWNNPDETPLLSAMALEARRIRVNLFCPGHKQGAHALPQLRSIMGTQSMQMDLPELPNLDNLFAPEGVIADSQLLAAQTFTEGPDFWNTFFLVNGSTCGIEAAIMATVKPHRKIVLPRNAHQSAVHALVLSGAKPVWVEPQYDHQNDLLHGVSVSSIAKALEENANEVDAVLVISPTYHGVCSDITAIAKATHSAGARLIVDEAHGAHFAFHDLLPTSSTYCNADIVIQSTHKTLGAWSQAAMMHVRKSSIDKQQIASALQLMQSTSPNYLLLSSLEAARALMDREGEHLMFRTIKLAQSSAIRIASLPGFSVLGINGVGMSSPDDAESMIHDLDPTRITVILPPGISGYEIDTHLIDRFGVYAELPSFRHITFVFSPGNDQNDVDTLVTSLSLYEATSDLRTDLISAESPTSKFPVFGEQTMVSPRDAFFAESERVDADDAIGRVSVETLCPYPPGIPVIVPGERISAECIQLIRSVLDAGGSVSGASDESLSTIRVLSPAVERRMLG